MPVRRLMRFSGARRPEAGVGRPHGGRGDHEGGAASNPATTRLTIDDLRLMDVRPPCSPCWGVPAMPVRKLNRFSGARQGIPPRGRATLPGRSARTTVDTLQRANRRLPERSGNLLRRAPRACGVPNGSERPHGHPVRRLAGAADRSCRRSRGVGGARGAVRDDEPSTTWAASRTATTACVRRRDYVLKIANPASNPVARRAQCAAVERLADAMSGLRLPRAHAGVDGEVVQRLSAGGVDLVCRLLDYVPGEPIMDSRYLAPPVVARLGELAGQVVAGLADFAGVEQERPRLWDLRNAPHRRRDARSPPARPGAGRPGTARVPGRAHAAGAVRGPRPAGDPR